MNYLRHGLICACQKLEPKVFKIGVCNPRQSSPSFFRLMRPNKAETAVHGCHCPVDMAVRMRKVLVRPWVGVRVSLAFIVDLYDRDCW